jgi:integrase/recombinase XerD
MSQQVHIQVPEPDRILDLFIEDCHDRELSDETIRRCKSIVRQLLRFLEEVSVGAPDVDKHVPHEYIRERRSNGIDQKTLENELSGVASFYDFLVFEDFDARNAAPSVRKRFLCRYKVEREGDAESPRKLISIEEMSMLLNSIIDTRDKAVLTLLAKTGLRRGDLISLDTTSVNWVEQSITLQLKQFKKRSGRTVFFDGESAHLLKRWLKQRDSLHPDTPALFTNERCGRLKRHGIYRMTVKCATAVGLHDPNSEKVEDHFTPHCFRHWSTTNLRRAGMDRELIKALRGDRRRDVIDVYDRIDRDELRRSCTAHIPQLGL